MYDHWLKQEEEEEEERRRCCGQFVFEAMMAVVVVINACFSFYSGQQKQNKTKTKNKTKAILTTLFQDLFALTANSAYISSMACWKYFLS